MAETVLAGSHDWFQDRYNSYEHHTISFDIKVTGEGQDRERSFDVWASYAEIENLVVTTQPLPNVRLSMGNQVIQV
jgi:hypothetical protein